MIAAVVALMSAAAPCPAIEGGTPALAAIDPAQRRRHVALLVEEAGQRARLWSAAWAATFTAMIAVQLAIMPLQDADDRADGAVGAASAALGLVPLVALPLPAAAEGRALVAEAERWSTARGECAALAEVEARLVRAAEAEALGTSWVAHVGNAAINLILGAILGFGLEHWTSAALTVGIGMAVGELQIFTQPAALPEALEAYRAGRWVPADATVDARPRPWSVVLDGGAIVGVAVRF